MKQRPPSPPDDGRRPTDRPLQEIHVRGQYGASFRFRQDPPRGDAAEDRPRITAFESIMPNVGSPPSKKSRRDLLAVGSYFIKCPDTKLSQQKQDEFVQREFDNGSSINHVAERMKGQRFTISKMVGRGVLHNPDWGTDDRPCLIYEYAGDRDETNCTLSREWRKAYDGSTMKFLEFAEAFARAVQVLHNQGIVHTFLVPRNIVWSRPSAHAEIATLDGQFTIVGFGYARQTDAAGRHLDEGSDAPQFRVADEDNWFRAPECRQAHSHAAFGYPADIYSIGAILYSVLLKQDSDGLDVLRAPTTDDRLLKRRIAQRLKDARKKDVRRKDLRGRASQDEAKRRLLQDNENILKIIDSCLRYDAENRYTCVEELIESIQIARKADPARVESAASPQPPRHLTIDKSFVDQLSSALLPGSAHKTARAERYFAELRVSLAEDLEQRYGGLGRGHFEVYGHRDRIVTSLCRLLGSAKPGDLYRTMTLPDYWTDGNLGSLGRFLTMNKHMARRGVRIERLFLVSRDFHSLPEEEQVVLEDQLDALIELEREDVAEVPVLKVLQVSEAKIADFERNGELVAYLQEKGHQSSPEDVDNTTICLNFFSTAKETWSNGRVTVRRTIKKARYWNPAKVHRTDQFEKSLKSFEGLLHTAQMLKDFIHPEGQPKQPSTIELVELIGSRGKSATGGFQQNRS